MVELVKGEALFRAADVFFVGVPPCFGLRRLPSRSGTPGYRRPLTPRACGGTPGSGVHIEASCPHGAENPPIVLHAWRMVCLWKIVGVRPTWACGQFGGFWAFKNEFLLFEETVSGRLAVGNAPRNSRSWFP